MSLIFTNTPPDFQPVLADGLFFTTSADTTNTFKFRYVYELYVENALVFTGKATPNPFGLGIIDLQQILETYCFNNPISVWDTTDIYTHTTFPFSRPYNDETISYYIKCGYEYSSTELGIISGFTGNGSALGLPGVASNVLKTFRSTMGVNGRATQQDFNIDPFVLSGSPSTLNPTTSGLFLTNAPRIQDISNTDYYTLAFTNYYMGTSMLSEPYYVQYKFYDDQGAEITGTTYDNITINGGGPRTSCTEVYQSLFLINPPTETDYNTLYLGAGPMNIPNIPTGTTQYTVQLFGKFTGSTSPLQPTPTPTPSPNNTTPTPTPTPTATPTCACAEYYIENTGATSANVSFVNCSNGQTQTFALPTLQATQICSCDLPISESDLIITLVGGCYVPPVTPTPTPSSTPCECGEYEVENTGNNFPVLFFTFCDGQSYTYTLYPGYNELNCGCVGTFTCSDPNVSISYTGPC